jgi:hypothetical protein
MLKPIIFIPASDSTLAAENDDQPVSFAVPLASSILTRPDLPDAFRMMEGA